MHLSLLSDGYVSDSYNDAGPMVGIAAPPRPGSLHFIALCRGIIVVLALAIPVSMTLIGGTHAQSPASTIEPQTFHHHPVASISPRD